MAPNPEHDRIKQSIDANGVDLPFTVAERPDGKYVVSGGGNTRLRVLQEIHAKKMDETTVQCLVQSNRSSGEMLLAHLRENDIRARLTFIEKAMSIERMKEHFGLQEVSQRDVCSALADRGFAVAQSKVPIMAYAVQRLYPHMPEALKGGMGRPSIEALSHVDTAAGKLWTHWSLEDTQPYDEVFGALCRRHSRRFVADLFESDIAYEISELADCSQQTATLALAEAMSGNLMDRPKTLERRSTSGDDPLPDGQWPSLAGSSADDLRGTDSPRLPPARTVKNPAQNLADRFGIGMCVSPDPDSPIGIRINQPPDDQLRPSLSADEWITVQLVWWSLAQASHHDLVTTQEDIPIEQLARGLWAALDDRSWKDYLTTLKTYRQATRPVEGQRR